MKNFIRKLKKLLELTPEQLKYAEKELKTIFSLRMYLDREYCAKKVCATCLYYFKPLE